MIRLTRQTDYGIVLLTRFASGEHRPTHNARELAHESHLPLPMVSKILKALVRAGLLVSHRGVKGGYGLARKPEDITIASVIRALDGPIALTDCSLDGEGSCEHETFCGVRSNWQRINAAVVVALDALTLADMAQPMPADGPLLLPRNGARRALPAGAAVPAAAASPTVQGALALDPLETA